MKRILAVVLMILTVTTLTACGRESGLKDVETVTYTHPAAGYQVTVPKDWEKQIEDEISTVFNGEQPPVVFDVVYEIGGFDYYAPESLAEEVCAFLGKKISQLEILEKAHGKGRFSQWFLAKGYLEKDQEIRISGWIYQPDTGIRYYLLFVSGAKDYHLQKNLFDQIAGTFKLTLEPEELYRQLKDRKEKETR